MLPALLFKVMEGFQENARLAVCTALEKEGWTESCRETGGHSGFSWGAFWVLET